METSDERFPKTFGKCVGALFIIKGSLARGHIIISINPTKDNNYVSTDIIILPKIIIMLVLTSLTN